MPRSLAEGHIKLAILITKPTNPLAPTLTELTAGIDAACNILSSDFTFGATDSDKVAEKALCVENNAQAIGASNYSFGLTPFRYFTALGASAPTEGDTVFQAVKAKGTTLWVYARNTSKKSVAPWAASDEIYLGAEVVTDEPQSPSERGGYIKYRVPGEVQAAYPFIAVAT